MTKAWQQLLVNARVSCIAKTLAPYMWFNDTITLLLVLSKQLQGSSSLKLLTTLQFTGSSVTKRQGADDHVYSLSDPMEKAMRLVTYYMFENCNFSF